MSTFGSPILGGFGFGFGGPWGYGPLTVKVDAPPDPAAKAEPSEPLDRNQWSGYAAAQMGLPGFTKAPAGTDLLYWQMRKYSACVLAFAVTAGPIFAGTRTLEICQDDGTPAAKRPAGPLAGDGPAESPEDRIKAAMERHFNPLWPDILNGLECLNFGRWCQEVTWERKNGLTLPVEFRDFRPGEAGILYDAHGDFAGLRYNNQDLAPQYVLHHVHEPHLDRLNGYPRLENCRQDWWYNHETEDRLGRAERKASGISLMVLIDHEFAFRDNTGNKVSQKAAAQTFVDALATGGTALGPRFSFKHDTIAGKPELAEHKPIEAQQFDWGNTAPAILACISVLDARDRRIMRSFGRPEREAMEGTHGTKAEAGIHKDTGTLDCEKVANERYRDFNRQTWRTTLLTNYGETYVDRLCWVPTPLADESKQFLQTAALAMLAAPGDPLPAQVDRKALLQKVELPYDESYTPQPALPAGPTPPEGGPGTDGQPQPAGANGNGKPRSNLLGLSAGRWGDEADGPFDDYALALDCGTGAGGFKPGNKCQRPGSGGTAANEAQGDKAKFVGEKVGKAEHEYAAKVEQRVARAVGGRMLDDNEPLDVRVQPDEATGQGEHAVEVKSLLKGGKQSLSVHDDALIRKVDYAAANPESTYHTVAVDHRDRYEGGAHAENYSGHELYYKRGSGRYSLSKMYPVRDRAELAQLVRTPDAELPEAAKGELPSGKAADKLRESADRAHASRLAKDLSRKRRIAAAKRAAKA